MRAAARNGTVHRGRGFVVAVGVSTLFSPLGCGDEASWPVPGSEVVPQEGASIESVTRDLAPGDTGPDVQAVQTYLSRYGYFPNEELARAYPSWQAVVAESPQSGTYDAATEAGVRAYQAMMGLTATGVVDPATRETMRLPRCGFPDGVRPRDPEDKFDLAGSFWTKTTLTWRVQNNPGYLTNAQIEAALRPSFAVWDGAGAPNALTNLTFQFTTSADADIDIRFGPLGATAPDATASPPSFQPHVHIIFNTSNRSSGQPRTWTEASLRALAVHEIGHTLGLDHSAFDGAVMRPGVVNTVPQPDDRLAVGILYDPWQTVAGCAIDISVGPGAGGAFTVWALGCNGTEGLAHRWGGGNTWYPDLKNGFGKNIAVEATGIPWIVRAPVGDMPNVFRRSSSDPGTGGWEPKGNICAEDIGVGPNGLPWVSRCSDGSMHRWNGSTWVQDPGAIGRRVAVDGDNKPWITDRVNNIHRKNSSSPTSGTWEKLDGKAIDIAVHRGGLGQWAWIIGVDFSVQAWNEQPGLKTGDCALSGVCERKRWRTKLGGMTATRIGMGGFGPWVTRNTGTIHRELNW